MSNQQNPGEQLKSEISSLQNQVGDLHDQVRLSNVRDAIEDLQTTVSNLDQKVADLRTRGYVFGKDLEAQAQDFEKQWTKLCPSVKTQINQQATKLQAKIPPIEKLMSQLAAKGENVAAARPIHTKAKAAVDALEDEAESAGRSVNGMYDSLRSQVTALVSNLNKVDWMLQELSEASFQLLAAEAGIMAVKAVWIKGSKEQKDDPEGVLYLTDQRLFFEQKEKVTTKKVLFIATEKETVQNLLLEIPVASVDTVDTSKQGLLKNEDHINVKFESGAPVREAHFHIWQSCEDWQALIQRAKAKEFDKDRAVALDQKAIEKAKSAPSQCPSCGGNINQVILRGQDEIECEYCGFTIRL